MAHLLFCCLVSFVALGMIGGGEKNKCNISFSQIIFRTGLEMVM